MTDALNEDVFSHILSFIYDIHTLHTLLACIPPTHQYFIVVLRRRCALPIPLACDDSSASADTERVLDLLTSSQFSNNIPLTSLQTSITSVLRHLVIESGSPPLRPRIVALRKRLTHLFEITPKLEVLDWCGQVGPSDSDLQVLKGCERLRRLDVDCHVRVDGGYFLEDSWDIDEFTKSLGPSITDLSLRHVNLRMYNSLLSHKTLFQSPSYDNLTSLALDLTQGVWDWGGGGSPQAGASSDFTWVDLGFPNVRELELKVGDLTVCAERPGPMEIVSWEALETVRLFVEPCIFPSSLYNIRIFASLPPHHFRSLKTLEIRDVVRNVSPWRWPDEEAVPPHTWSEPGRTYWGIVENFLSSAALQNLTHLWVNENVLAMPKGPPAFDGLFSDGGQFYTVDELFGDSGDEEADNLLADKREWLAALRAILGRLESLRLGLGALSAREVGLVLGLCDPHKLTHFGFAYRWRVADCGASLPPDLLTHFTASKLTRLTDLHMLQPRPGTQDVYRLPSRGENAATIEDVESLFASHVGLCRVGWGQGVVWERRPNVADLESTIVLVQDGFNDVRLKANTEIQPFFDIGVLEGYGECESEPRQDVGREVRELREVLGRVLGD
ncbi:hypothetical protein DXG03_003046 [Asterophora parasitica]|uniref:Uncharacterized protein n=1 Tax=Asterophora parasitica TaxID=117018 RepID=A0A9P7G1C2_9AGAR|nr:hypothetical protein DXG03_003046 [Asterophora parasitica]